MWVGHPHPNIIIKPIKPSPLGIPLDRGNVCVADKGVSRLRLSKRWLPSGRRMSPTMGGHGYPHNKCRARCLHLAAARCWHRALQGRRMRGKKTDEHCSSLRWEGTQTLPYKIKRRYAYQMYGRRMRDKNGRAPTELQQRKTDRRALNALQFRLQQQDRQKQGTALQAAILSFRRINGITYQISP